MLLYNAIIPLKLELAEISKNNRIISNNKKVIIKIINLIKIVKIDSRA